MVRVRFAPSPTGSLHVGGALVAAANRRFASEHGGTLLLRIDDTDRSVPGGEEAIVEDLGWLGIDWDEGPVRQSERVEAHVAAAERLVGSGAAAREDGAVRFLRARGRPTLVRGDGRPTYHLASVVDDVELAITHVIRGKDLLPSTPLHVALAEALGAAPPDYVHVGLVLAEEGGKLSKRVGGSTVADLRAAGIPAEAVRAYLDELNLPRGDVRLDPARLRRLATDAVNALPDAELARRVGAPIEVVPALRGARDLVEARAYAELVLAPATAAPGDEARPTLERFRELRSRAPERLDSAGARELVRELKAVGGDLRALRLALTGAPRGPELWAVVAALPRDEAVARAGRASI